MRETRGGGTLAVTIVGIVLLLMAAGGWILWGRGAWDRYQIRGLLRGALEEHEEGNLAESKKLLSQAAKRVNLDALPSGPERNLMKAHLVREAYEEQLRRPPQPVTIRPKPRGLWTFQDLRNESRQFRLPCPAVVEFLAVLLARGVLD